MPRIGRTILPRIKKSVQQRGVWASIRRSVFLPGHLIREYRETRKLTRTHSSDAFDRDYEVDTDGEFDGWTYLSDLEIPSTNWIHGNNYAAIDPVSFRAAMSTLPIKFEDFVFVDFGSGKGRALILASEFPFKRIIGVEFSPELHAIAQSNIQKYSKSGPSKSEFLEPASVRLESMCMDFLDFPLPLEPSVFLLFDPCDEYVLEKLLFRIGASLAAHPRRIHLIYLAPALARERMLDSSEFLAKVARNSEHNFCLYKSA